MSLAIIITYQPSGGTLPSRWKALTEGGFQLTLPLNPNKPESEDRERAARSLLRLMNLELPGTDLSCHEHFQHPLRTEWILLFRRVLTPTPKP